MKDPVAESKRISTKRGASQAHNPFVALLSDDPSGTGQRAKALQRSCGTGANFDRVFAGG